MDRMPKSAKGLIWLVQFGEDAGRVGTGFRLRSCLTVGAGIVWWPRCTDLQLGSKAPLDDPEAPSDAVGFVLEGVESSKHTWVRAVRDSNHRQLHTLSNS